MKLPLHTIDGPVGPIRDFLAGLRGLTEVEDRVLRAIRKAEEAADAADACTLGEALDAVSTVWLLEGDRLLLDALDQLLECLLGEAGYPDVANGSSAKLARLRVRAVADDLARELMVYAANCPCVAGEGRTDRKVAREPGCYRCSGAREVLARAGLLPAPPLPS